MTSWLLIFLWNAITMHQNFGSLSSSINFQVKWNKRKKHDKDIKEYHLSVQLIFKYLWYKKEVCNAMNQYYRKNNRVIWNTFVIFLIVYSIVAFFFDSRQYSMFHFILSDDFQNLKSIDSYFCNSYKLCIR